MAACFPVCSKADLDLPLGGLAEFERELILARTRFISEALVPTNLIGNAVATIVVSKWEGALDEAKMQSVLADESEVEAEESEKVLA